MHMLGEEFDKASVGYAATWWHPGAAHDLPNLKVIFSLGAGVDHLADRTSLPKCRWCGWSRPTSRSG